MQISALRFVPAILLCVLPVVGQNSTKKIRPEPSPLAARAGSGVEWRKDLATALVEAQEGDLPVFCYVATIHRSFVDREPELDRKMLAGPFSWPRLIGVLNEAYVPVRVDADQALCKRLGISRENFLPPGIVVLEGGVVSQRIDRISTHHPGWYAARFGSSDDARARTSSITLAEQPDAAEALYLSGVGVGAIVRVQAWNKLMSEFPDHPLAWKAAMELEGHGPLLRGQEVYTTLPDEAYEWSGAGTRAPKSVYDEAEVWQRSVEFLCALQGTDGAFRDSIYDFGGTDGLRHVHGAVTALASIALLRAQQQVETYAQADAQLLAQKYATEVALHPDDDTDERVWPQVYCLRALLEAGVTGADSVTQKLVNLLVSERGQSGAWRHEYANPFVTADVLIALWEAKQAGLTILNEAVVVREGTAAILRCRSTDGGYSYAMTRAGRNPRGSIQGSVGRAPRCELALLRWAPAEARSLEQTVALSFEHEGPLFEVQKLDDHGPKFAYGGFFFWYDLQARTEAIAALPAGAARTEFARRQHAQILSLPEVDGCFVDSHEIGRAYGTSMALWCLAILDGLLQGN